MSLTRRHFLKAGAGAASLALSSRLTGVASPARYAEAAFPSADYLGSDVACRVFELLYDIVKAERLPPTRASRLYALAGVTLYEAVVDGSRSDASLSGRINGFGRRRGGLTGLEHWPTVATVAMTNVIRGLLPLMSSQSRQSLLDLEGALEEPGLTFTVRDTSESHGLAIASAILSWAAHDLSTRMVPYATLGKAGAWVPTPPAFATAPLDPHWGRNRPMVLFDGEDMEAAGPPSFSEDRNSAFFKAAFEVYHVGMGLTPEQKYIAEFWADNPGATGTPPGHWIAITSQLVRRRGLSLMQAANAYARVGIATHDAFICCWHTKYATDLLRPVTYIQRYIDAGWLPYVPTPAFPTYTSGHSTQSGAAGVVLSSVFGLGPFTDTTHVDHGTTPNLGARPMASLMAAAEEAMVSRLYGGIHYAFDNLDGFEAGKRIGQAVLNRLA